MHLLAQSFQNNSKPLCKWDMGQSSLPKLYSTENLFLFFPFASCLCFFSNCDSYWINSPFLFHSFSKALIRLKAGRGLTFHNDNAATAVQLLLNQGVACHSTSPPSGTLKVQLPAGRQQPSRRLPPSSGEMPALQHVPLIPSVSPPPLKTEQHWAPLHISKQDIKSSSPASVTGVQRGFKRAAHKRRPLTDTRVICGPAPWLRARADADAARKPEQPTRRKLGHTGEVNPQNRLHKQEQSQREPPSNRMLSTAAPTATDNGRNSVTSATSNNSSIFRKV